MKRNIRAFFAFLRKDQKILSGWWRMILMDYLSPLFYGINDK